LEIYKLFVGSALAKSNASNVIEPPPSPVRTYRQSWLAAYLCGAV